MKKIDLLVVVTLLCIIFFVCQGIAVEYSMEEPIEENNEKSYSRDMMQETEPKTVRRVLTNKKVIEFECIRQLPELPTGCEITALTMVLNYYGYKEDKVFMAKNYLPIAEPYTKNFTEAFFGYPWSEYGWGCYSPVIVNTANRYLQENESPYYVKDVSGEEFEELLYYVQDNIPVMIWTTIGLKDNATKTEIILASGEHINWTAPEHCVVLIGYDKEDGKVLLADPLDGIIWRDMNFVKRHYDILEKQAVIIK